MAAGPLVPWAPQASDEGGGQMLLSSQARKTSWLLSGLSDLHRFTLKGRFAFISCQGSS